MILSLIVAASENDVIGKNNWLPWDLPDEMKYLRETTRGKPAIMGHKTYASIAAMGRAPIPGKHNIVISRDASLTFDGADVAPSVEDAMAVAKTRNPYEAFVFGGAQIYALALPLADRLYFTRVHTTIEDGDTFMPAIDWSQWKKVSSTEHPADDRHAYAFTMEVWERKKP